MVSCYLETFVIVLNAVTESSGEFVKGTLCEHDKQTKNVVRPFMDVSNFNGCLYQIGDESMNANYFLAENEAIAILRKGESFSVIAENLHETAHKKPKLHLHDPFELLKDVECEYSCFSCNLPISSKPSRLSQCSACNK